MKQHDLRFRQIHLDFHTSEYINSIGKDFNADEFAETLKKAHVNSITCFAKCHHGYIYYDSKKFPERIHPNLTNKNLLDEQIRACHERNIRVPIYITVGWDHYTANEHPEWLVIDEKGAPTKGIYEAGFYKWLCINSPYRELLKTQLIEVLEHFKDVDGIFFDMICKMDCSCKYCREDMLKKGIDPTNEEERKAYYADVTREFKKEMTAIIRKYSSNCSIFYNADSQKDALDTATHLEIEALPGDKWGYIDFLLGGLYARNLGKDYLGMTGKFHTSWADFHSFKNKAALEYECFRMLALNGKCLIGDQLEPNGKLSQPVYDLVGSVYSQVEKKEPWCKDAKAVVDIAVVVWQDMLGTFPISYICGAVKVLTESGHQFDIINPDNDLSKYKLLVLPDEVQLDEDFAKKLKAYIDNGGAVIASYESGLDNSKTKFALDEFGITYKGEAEYSPDFIVPTEKIGKKLPKTEHVMYMKGLEVDAKNVTEVLVTSKLPYNNRTWQHFCSHRHFPSSGKDGYNAVVKNGKVIYFMHPIFTQYDNNAPLWCKEIFLDAVDMLLTDRVIKHSGPSTMEVSINQQENEHRYVVHALHYIPMKRSQKMEIIEDVIPLYNIKFSVNVNQNVESIKLVPSGKPIEFNKVDNRIEFILPELNGHEMIEMCYNN